MLRQHYHQIWWDISGINWKKTPKKHEHRYHLQQQAALAVKTFIFPGYIKEDSSYIIEMTMTFWDLIPDAP